jgi:2-succinyl-5-enolpyruvyl-6-hydroxy-3-cyclohexene-1-carboxylate synthase
MEAFVDALASSGLRNACVSPGSRSTPLALALARRADVAVHMHLDERSSAFFALGTAKVTGSIAAVVCTSGTAAANFFPAVVEASMARVPLLVLTADRPPELRGVGANQAIDQLDLYGRYAKVSVDAPVPGDRPDPAEWQALGLDAVREALEHPPGPVHVNLPFREPLAPSGLERPSVGASAVRPARVRSAARTRRFHVDALRAALKESTRGVVVAGSLRLGAAPAVDLARTLGWPLLAEPVSGLRVAGALSAGQFLLSNEAFVDSHGPDVVLQLGGAPTSRAGLAFVGRAARLVVVDPDLQVADPGRHASMTLNADPASLCRALLDRIEPPRERSAWARSWEDADRAARHAVDMLIDTWEEPFEGRIARDLAACAPDGSALLVGSSMPVRDLDAFMHPRTGIRVLANRGASGIDGFVSTTFGVAASGIATFALLGDLTLLHDVGAVLWSKGHRRDAVLVVLNNRGGAIFSFLPQRALPEFEQLFATPHHIDLAKLATASGAGHLLVERSEELVPAVTKASESGGVWIVEVPTDRDANVTRHAEVHAAVAAALLPNRR